MAEITPKPLVAAVGSAGVLLNELATQVTMPRREWIVLSYFGAHVIVRQRPIDTLLGVLEAASVSGSGAQGEIGIFFES